MRTLECPACGCHDGIGGIEIQGVYDGVLIWQCPDCGNYWPRFPPDDRRHAKALHIIAGWPNRGGVT